MPELNLKPNSVWTETQITRFLSETRIPIRLACLDQDGFPLICSLWFYYEDGLLWSATHSSSHIIKVLTKNPKVAFEIGTNDYPYRGVRGKGRVELSKDRPDGVLARLIRRYLDDSNPQLTTWLMSRVENEYVLCLTPQQVTSWDFSNRMKKAEKEKRD